MFYMPGRTIMHKHTTMLFCFLIGLLVLTTNPSAQAGPSAEQRSLSIVFNDGHRQNIPLDEIARIEFKPAPVVVFRDGRQQSLSTAEVARIEFTSYSDSPLGRNHFVGKWQVGVGIGSETFFITLEPNGEARKSMGASHGTWTVIDGEARISWDDGWHDAIRKVGTKHEKYAYEPGKSFSDPPSNVTDAKNTTAQPI
jgi:hypothetical protein